MLRRIGRSHEDETLSGLLLGCHERIRRFGAMAVTLAASTPDTADDAGVAEAALAVRRYFAVALPLPEADEEQSIAPRLRGRDAAVDAALTRMSEQHLVQHGLIARVVELCEAIAAAPARRAELAAPAAALVAAMDLHLHGEETIIFPALAALPAADQDAIVGELRARRA